jgi:hypothetical protein
MAKSAAEAEKKWQTRSKIRTMQLWRCRKRKPKVSFGGEDNVDERCQINRIDLRKRFESKNQITTPIPS